MNWVIMQTLDSLSFRANVRIKDIVGRELINNDNVAIVELIKNSRDANSNNIHIQFSNAAKESLESSLIISDSGTGMSLDDIKHKWLNIAYSEKKQASKVSSVALAGSKGVGRFSCDRLGKQLDLYTKTKGGDLIWLPIDWTKYEVDERDTLISDIQCTPRFITAEEFSTKTGLKAFNSGTILVIQALRSTWDKEKLLRLRRDLERFIVDPDRKLAVELTSSDYEGDTDVNGPIENKVFEKLDVRTTSIRSEIASDGKTIRTTLRHDGNDIFTLTEKNPYPNLKQIRVSIFYLNQPAKAYFKRVTGFRLPEYGSVFLFLNGFRVIPYGEPGNDWLLIDRRKQQGHSRYLGTRELWGRVEITDKDGNFQPVSSREGLVNNNAYWELVSQERKIASQLDNNLQYGYIQKLLRKLEKFVVEGLDWDRISKDIPEEIEDDLSEKEIFEYLNHDKGILGSLFSIINLYSPDKYITDLKLNTKYLQELAQNEVDSYNSLVKELQGKFDGLPIAQMKPADKRDLSRFVQRQAKELAAKSASNQRLQDQAEQLTLENKATKQRLEVETKKRLFAESITTLDHDHVVKMQHQVGLLAGEAFKRFDYAVRKYKQQPENIGKDVLVDTLEKGLFILSKIKQLSKFASKANFDLSTNSVKADLGQFIEEYLSNICDFGLDWSVRISFENKSGVSCVRSFRPIELTMLVDNLIGNSAKAGAKKLTVDITEDKKSIFIGFHDNGKGIKQSKYKPQELFEKGITTTDGSGIGLYQAKQIADDLGGTITIEENHSGGASVIMELGKK